MPSAHNLFLKDGLASRDFVWYHPGKSHWAVCVIGEFERLLKTGVMRVFKSKKSKRGTSSAAMFEAMENRVLLAATPAQIASALDLPAGTVVSFSGDQLSVTTRASASATNVYQVLGFPTGRDDDFLMMSTGVADQIDTLPNLAGNQGTDLGAPDTIGDTSSVSFTLQVPASTSPQRLKFDFVFLSEEYDEFVGSQFNDFFTATVNGTNIAIDQNGNQVDVNNALFTGEAAAGTFFDGRTSSLTASFLVPNGVNTLNVVLSIGDVGDGIYDSAVLVDNVRFETPQVVFLDFDGGDVGSHFGPLTSLTLPAFSASDVNSLNSTASVINQIVTGLQSLYSDFDISFVTQPPDSGDFMTVVIGGSNDSPITVNDPLVVFGEGVAPTVMNYLSTKFPTKYTPTSTLFGRATSVDIGNRDRSDLGVIFSGEFGTFYAPENFATIIQRLTVTIAHEIGHNLGLRHIANVNNTEVMKQNSPRDPAAIFNEQFFDLAENGWYDAAETQDSHKYLTSVLGVPGESGLAPSEIPTTGEKTFLIDFSKLSNFFNGIISFFGGDSSDGPGDTAPLIFPISPGAKQVKFTLPASYFSPSVTLFGSTSPDGPINIFSGQAINGVLGPDNSTTIYNNQGVSITSLKISTGTPGSLTSFVTLPFFDITPVAGSITVNLNTLQAAVRDVRVTNRNGQIKITTGGAASKFTIDILAPAKGSTLPRFLITGIGTTTINGQRSITITAANIASITTGFQNDEITIRSKVKNASLNNFVLDTGFGNDLFTLEGVTVKGNSKLLMGNGRDRIVLKKVTFTKTPTFDLRRTQIDTISAVNTKITLRDVYVG